MSQIETNEKISVIIPIYKVEEYLDRCIKSVVGQTYKNLEIILVDDGSPDNCPKMCDEWAKKDKRIKVIHKQNGGLSDARNVGLDIATGDYIMFVDSDDWVDKTICEKLLTLLKETDADIAECGLYPTKSINLPQEKAKTEHSDQNKYNMFEGNEVLLTMFHGDFRISVWAKLYKNFIFNNLRFEVGKLFEDSFIQHKVLQRASRIVISEEPLYYYFSRPGSITKALTFTGESDRLLSFEQKIEDLIDIPYCTEAAINWGIETFRYYYLMTLPLIKNKNLKARVLSNYKKYYKLKKRKSLKDFAFRYFKRIYKVLFYVKYGKKLKNNF